MVGRMGKIGLTKEAALQNLSRNPQQLLGKMQAAIDPRILKQMGGAGNMMHLLKGSADMGDMQDVMRQLGGLGGGR
ncbi:hypothetical protein ACSSS7_006865 [Eimeria intestinalis]